MLIPLLTLLVCAEPLEATKPIIDRGDVRIGPQLVETFTLTNRTSTPLSITDVQSSCGCLTPNLNRRELKPGESATLTVEINTLSQPAGQIGWPVRVVHSAGALDLALRANLISEVQVQPAAVVFRIRQSRSVTVTITDTRSKPFRITGVGASSSQISAELVNSKNGISEVRLTATPEGAPGTRSEIAWINTDDPLYPQIRLPVTLTIIAPSKKE